MKILRVIDKETKLFLRDDFIFNCETEIGLSVEPSQGLIKPKWVDESVLDSEGNTISNGYWVEGAI